MSANISAAWAAERLQTVSAVLRIAILTQEDEQNENNTEPGNGLARYLAYRGLVALLGLSFSGLPLIMAILAIAAGILILIGR